MMEQEIDTPRLLTTGTASVVGSHNLCLDVDCTSELKSMVKLSSKTVILAMATYSGYFDYYSESLLPTENRYDIGSAYAHLPLWFVNQVYSITEILKMQL